MCQAAYVRAGQARADSLCGLPSVRCICIDRLVLNILCTQVCICKHVSRSTLLSDT